MKKKLRLEVFQFLDNLHKNYTIPTMSLTNVTKHVQREFNLTWDDSKKAVAQWVRAIKKAGMNTVGPYCAFKSLIG
jgi:hypothetical protein